MVNATDLDFIVYLENLTDSNSGITVLDYDNDDVNSTGYFGELVTSDGEVNTTSFKILSSGLFKVVVEGSGNLDLYINPSETDSFYITNKIKEISLYKSPSTPLIYEDFNISVVLTGEDDNVYLGESTIEIQGQSNITFLSDSLSYSPDTTNIFQAYSNETGTSDLEVSVTNGTSSDLSEIISLTVVNSKLKIELSQTVNFT